MVSIGRFFLIAMNVCDFFKFRKKKYIFSIENDVQNGVDCLTDFSVFTLR